MDYRLIKMFGVTDGSSKKVDYARVNSLAMQVGYIVAPEACCSDVMAFLQTLDINTNSTFYKTWQDVTSKSRLELLLDQLTHYAAAYYADITWVPNDEFKEKVNVNFSEYKLITVASKEDIANRCINMFASGIALDNNTIDIMVNYVVGNAGKVAIDRIDEVVNREALIHLCHRLKIVPNKSFDILRYFMFELTGNAMIIKDERTLNIIATNTSRIRWKNISEKQMIELSKIFYRFKPIFLAMKNTYDARPVINKIRRYAKKYHTPLKEGFWETVATKIYPLDEIKLRLEEDKPSNFKVLRLMQCIKEQILISTNQFGPACYIIRNGKVWIDRTAKEQPVMSPKYEYWDFLYAALEKYVVDNLKKKACTIRYPKDLVLTCPISEKNFFGNIPFGSFYHMPDEDGVFGVHWDNKSGINDIDLSFVSMDGCKVGWNSGYYIGNHSVIYSGDIVRPDPEATELIYCRKDCPDGIIYANLFNGDSRGKFDVFFGSEKMSGNILNRMIKRKNIKVIETISFESSQQQVGIIIDGDAYPTNIRVGNSIVSGVGGADLKTKVMHRKLLSAIPLKDILDKAGFKERKINTEDNPIKIDLYDLQKDTLIDLFS